MKKHYSFFIFAVFGFLVVGLALFFNFNALAVDQVKTTEFFITSSTSTITSATSTPFTIYIGDNLSGISNPVKSVYFTVAGVYTGNGSLELKIDNDSATAKTFTFPSVSTPTTFEILYKDDSNKINPTSAGSYTYTLYLTPSGVTISGLSAKVSVTHRFVPPSCPDGSPNNEKIKNTEFFVFSSDSQISAATSSQFTIYIGDNLSGVSNPVKSVYFTVAGVYTGNGSLELKIDNDSATAKTFTFPSVSTPTTFEILYKDDSNKINPSSAGTYNYTLYLTPSGITISGLSVKMVETHRYKPPACGGAYPAYGDLTSMVFDTGTDGAAYNSIMWKGALGTGGTGKVRLKIATSDNDTGPWEYRGPGPTCSTNTTSDSDWYVAAADTPAEIGCFPSHNNKRYFRYKVQICSSSDCSTAGSNTPQVDDVVISWSP